MGIHRRRLGRSTIALAGTVAVLAGAGSAVRAAGAAAGRAGQRRSGRRDQPRAQRQRRGSGQRRRRRRRADRRQGRRALGGVPPDRSPAATTTRSSRARSRAAPGRRAVTAPSAAARARRRQFSGSLNFDQTRTARHRRSTSPVRAGPCRGRRGTRTPPARASTATTSSPAAFDATQNKWVFAGQGRGTGGTDNVPVPSLNIHTNQDAENPSVAGGNAAQPARSRPARPMDHVAGDVDGEAGNRTRSSSSGRSGPARRTAQASHRAAPPPRPPVASAGSRPGSIAFGSPDAGPEPERRSRARRDRARHRLHRRAGLGAVGRLV